MFAGYVMGPAGTLVLAVVLGVLVLAASGVVRSAPRTVTPALAQSSAAEIVNEYVVPSLAPASFLYTFHSAKTVVSVPESSSTKPVGGVMTFNSFITVRPT
jgi:hypothetical protein